jgi:hypothetical protein
VLKLEEKTQIRSRSFGFVAALKQSGSGFLWSTLLPNAQLNALALDGVGNVFVTGRVSTGLARSGDDVLVAELSDYGRRLSYAASLGGAANQEGRAISTSPRGAWVFVAGATDSPKFLRSSLTNASPQQNLSFAVALQPCRTGVVSARLFSEVDNRTAPGIALTPALDAFTTASSGNLDAREMRKGTSDADRVYLVAPDCPTPRM